MAGDNFKSGFVAIIGRPNGGKSTLLNALIDNKISIVSKIPQTTRHLVRGILNVSGAQVVFVDSRGIHMFKDTLTQHLNVIAKKSLLDTELILYVVDVSRSFGQEEENIMDYILQQKSKIVMALNKIDISNKFVNEYLGNWQEKLKGKKFPVTGKKKMSPRIPIRRHFLPGNSLLITGDGQACLFMQRQESA